MEKQSKVALEKSVYEILLEKRTVSSDFVTADAIRFILNYAMPLDDIKSVLKWLQAKGLIENDGFKYPTMWRARTPVEIAEWKVK